MTRQFTYSQRQQLEQLVDFAGLKQVLRCLEEIASERATLALGVDLRQAADWEKAAQYLLAASLRVPT